MTYESERPTLIPALEGEPHSYVDWSAVIAGIVFASAISVVMLAFGSALGLSFASVASKGTAIAAAIGAAIWFLWVEVSGFMAGAYLTGRLRKHIDEATKHETEIRDGSHGLLVWAGGVIVGTVLALSTVSSAINSAGSVVKAAADTTAIAAQGVTSGSMQYYTDTLLRAPAQTASTTPRSDPTCSRKSDQHDTGALYGDAFE